MRCLWAALLVVGRAEDVGYAVFDPLTQAVLAGGVIGTGAGIAFGEALHAWREIETASCLETCCATTTPLFKFNVDVCNAYNAQSARGGGEKRTVIDP